MTRYTCEKCGKKFKQKSHYETHLNKVQPCVTEEKVLEVKKLKKSVKKLKTVVEKRVDDIDEETQNIILEDDNVISNKDMLRDKIHEIHNYLRNHGAGYGMNALKVFNILYGLKKIEESGLMDTVNLRRPECEFSHLLTLSDGSHDEELAEMIFTTVLPSVHQSNVRDLIFYKLPSNITGSTFAYLIKEINKITLIEQRCNVLLSGKIYEYFIGRDESAISELGAYFTDRHITKYIYDKMEPVIYDDGSVPTMIDMFGGSGGFTTGYVEYLNQHNSINWATEISKIHHYDMNEDVIKSAALEIFCLTGTIPNMDNIKYKNSFKDEFIGNDRSEMKYDYIVTNPPYGGDSTKKTGSQIKRDKLKDEIKKRIAIEPNASLSTQLSRILREEKADKMEQAKRKVTVSTGSNRIARFASEHGLNGNNKEACSLILMMELLASDGVCAGVLKEGVFFDGKYKNLRKQLIENYNVSEIISVPQDQFENTSTKTSIIIFSNTGPTTEIVFREMIVDKVQNDTFDIVNGTLVLAENKDDIREISDRIISQATCEEILSNKICSFNGKDYNLRGITAGEGYKLVKLGDICDYQNGFAFKSSNYQDSGIPIITIKNINNGQIDYNSVNYVAQNSAYDIYKIKQNDIILTLTGKKPSLCSVAIKLNHQDCYLNQRCMAIKNFKNIDANYIYYIFQSILLPYINTYMGSGSVQENISTHDILNLQIPVPKSNEKMQYWINKISTPYLKILELESEIKSLEEEIKTKIIEIVENEEHEEVRLGDVIQYVKTPIHSASEGKKSGLYNFYTSSQTKNLYLDTYDFEDKHLLLGRGGNTSIHIAEYFSVSSEDVFIIKCNTININYLYYYIKNIVNIDALFKGSTIKHLSKVLIAQIQVKIPRDKKKCNSIDNIINNVNSKINNVKQQKELYNQYLQELKEEAIN